MSHDPGMTLDHWLPWQAVPALIIVSLLTLAVGAAVSWLIRRRCQRHGSR